MKKLLFFIMLASLFACSKDDQKEKTAYEYEQEVFNTLIGKWQFSRAAEDSDFTKLIDAELTENDKDNYIQFFADSTCVCQYYEFDDYNPKIKRREGTFYINWTNGYSTDDVAMAAVEMDNEGVLVTKIKNELIRQGNLVNFICDKETFSCRSYLNNKKIFIEYKRIHE